MNAHEILTVASLLEGIARGKSIAIALDDSLTQVLHGTLRHLCPEEGSGAHARWDSDVMSLWVRVTATFEHWFSVEELVEALNNGSASIDI